MESGSFFEGSPGFEGLITQEALFWRGVIMLRLGVFLLLIVGVSAIICPPAFALAGEYGPDHPIIQQTEWPSGLANLLGAWKPVYANWVNFQDNFYFSGDAATFNAFMEAYGKLEGISHTLVLHSGKGEVKDRIGEPATYAFDWYVFVVPPMIPDGGIAKDHPYKRYVTVNLYLGCSIQLSEIKVPANVKVVSGGEIEKFIKQHQAKSVSAEFGIYLLADEKMNAVDALKVKLDDITLQTKPLFALDDFVCYSWEDHWFKLTPEALKKLPKPSPPENRLIRGIPFVLLVNGERIYMGAFWTSISSLAFPNPVIIADEMWLPSRLNWLTIDRAYPGATEEQYKDDIRNSAALRTALEAAGKLAACKGLERPPSGGFSSTTQSASPE